MRRVWMLVAVAVLSVGAAIPGAKADVANGPQWVLLEVTANKPTEFTARVYAPSVERDGAGPMVYGLGWGGNTNPGEVYNGADDAYLSLNVLDDADWSVTTSKNAGGIDRTVAPRTRIQPMVGWDGATLDFRLVPPGPMYLLVFVTNAHFTDSPIDIIGDDVVVEEKHGNGTGVMSAADATNDGYAASAGPLGVGTIRRDGVAPDGVVGTFVTACNCSGTWTSPDGRGAQWAATNTSAYTPVLLAGGPHAGDPGFAGPAGRWTLSYTGVSGLPLATATSGDVPPVVAAWANIGPDWEQFKTFRQ